MFLFLIGLPRSLHPWSHNFNIECWVFFQAVKVVVLGCYMVAPLGSTTSLPFLSTLHSSYIHSQQSTVSSLGWSIKVKFSFTPNFQGFRRLNQTRVPIINYIIFHVQKSPTFCLPLLPPSHVGGWTGHFTCQEWMRVDWRGKHSWSHLWSTEKHSSNPCSFLRGHQLLPPSFPQRGEVGFS